MANKAYLHPVMKSREDYEDMFHDMLSLMLPKYPKSNIRPAFQKTTNIAAGNLISDSFNDGLEGFTINSDFMYFKVILDEPNEIGEPYIEEDGKVSYTRFISVVLNIYGPNSANTALIIKSLVRAPFVSMYINKLGMYLYRDDGIKQFNDIINSQPWERRDITLIFNECIEVDPIEQPEEGSANVEVIQ